MERSLYITIQLRQEPEPEPFAEPESEADVLSSPPASPLPKVLPVVGSCLVAAMPHLRRLQVELFQQDSLNIQSHSPGIEEVADILIMAWRRNLFLERWQVVSPVVVHPSKFPRLRTHLQRVAVIDEWIPCFSNKSFRHLVVCGATFTAMRMRLAFAIMLNRTYGFHFKSLVVLASGRPVSEADIHRKMSSLDVPRCFADLLSEYPVGSTEAELAQHLATSCPNLALGPTWHTLTVINVPMQYHRAGWRRPNFADTVQAWVATRPEEGKTLFISSQPHLPRYSASLRGILANSHIEYELAGPGLKHAGLALDWRVGASANVLAVTLDAVAHWVQEEIAQLA